MPNLNTGILSAVPMVLPPIEAQRNIAATLGALDDRIALLRETNATLEAIAQALFKSWIVDFEPVHAKATGLYMICTISKHAAEKAGYTDAMMLDYRGYIAESTGSNVFFVKDGALHTPTPDCFLNGITRQTIIQMLKDKGLTVHERRIKPEEMADFSECWLTGTAAEVTPVGQIGDYMFQVGNVTREVAAEYEKLVRA